MNKFAFCLPCTILAINWQLSLITHDNPESSLLEADIQKFMAVSSMFPLEKLNNVTL